MQYSIAMHVVAVLALDGVLAFDLSTPIEVFGRARLPDGRMAYGVRVCAPVKAPFSWPNNSDSNRFSGIAPQFTAMNGFLARCERP